jgi:hypothetical protein
MADIDGGVGCEYCAAGQVCIDDVCAAADSQSGNDAITGGGGGGGGTTGDTTPKQTPGGSNDGATNNGGDGTGFGGAAIYFLVATIAVVALAGAYTVKKSRSRYVCSDVFICVCKNETFLLVYTCVMH